MVLALFSDLPPGRKRELGSAVGHYIAGVLDRAAMVQIIEALSRAADLLAGTRVRTLRGSVRGVITRVLEDGRVAVRADGAAGEMISLPENLMPDD
jgi:flavin-dependent dehydrogenase